MKFIPFLLFIVVTSCNTEVECIGCGPETITKECDSELDNYPTLSYTYFEKKELGKINTETVFDADVQITSTDSLINQEQLFCFCMAIGKNQKLINSRYYFWEESYLIAKKYNVSLFNNFNARKIIKDDAEFKTFRRSAIASLDFGPIDEDWTQKINSDNMTTMGFSSIANRMGDQRQIKWVVK